MFSVTIDHPDLGSAAPQVLSRHRSLDTARRQARRYARAVRRVNGPCASLSGLAVRGPDGKLLPLTAEE